MSVHADEFDLEEVAHRLGLESGSELKHQIGAQVLDVKDVLSQAFPAKTSEFLRSAQAMRLNETTANQLIDIKNMSSASGLHLCEDCSPVLGDRIVGVQRKNEVITVHAIDCNRLAEEDDEQARWLDLSWSGMPPGGIMATGRVRVTANNRPGVLAQVCQAIADSGANIRNVRTGETSIDFTELLFDIEVADLKHLTMILSSLRTFSFVDHVERIRN